MNSQEEQCWLSITVRRGMPMPMAGVVFWLAAGVLGLVLPENIVPLVYLFGIGLVLPLGLLIAKLMGIDMFVKHPLNTIGGLVGGMQILFAPIVIAVYKVYPEWLPYVTAVLTGAHFLPFQGIYNSRSYLFLSIGVVSLTSILWLIGDKGHIVPFVVAVVFALTVLGLQREHRQAVQSQVGMKKGSLSA